MEVKPPRLLTITSSTAITAFESSGNFTTWFDEANITFKSYLNPLHFECM